MQSKIKKSTFIMKNTYFAVMFLLLFFHVINAYSAESLSNYRLSDRPVKLFYNAGKNTNHKIRWFSDDDFGLSQFLEHIRSKGIAVSSPYELLPIGKNFVFVGIENGMKKCSAEEIIDFARKGNLVVLLLNSEKYLSYARKFAGNNPPAAANDKSILNFDMGNGRIVLIRDPYAFCNARFKENRALWEHLLKGRTIKALRIVQQARYAREDRTIFTSSGNKKILYTKETDPAFAPSFTDSNSKKYYEMTQNYYFLSEEYILDGEEVAWKSMMRVRAYDNFVPPDTNNPAEWHFSISQPQRSPVSPTDTIPSGYKKLKVSTCLSKAVPWDKVTLASMSPESCLLNVKIYSVKLPDKKLENKLANELKRKAEATALQKKKAEETPWWSIVKKKSQDNQSTQIQPVEQSKAQQMQKEYDAIRQQNRRIGKGIPDQEFSGIQKQILRDSLNNWTIQLHPKVSPVFIVYEAAVPEIFLRLDDRDFKDELIPDHLSLRELCRQQRLHGIKPCPVPPHEKEALRRMIGKERFQWFRPGKASMGKYLPTLIEQALLGKDVPVKQLFQTLSNYALNELQDTDVFMKEEFSSFHEAMLYWKAGVCRHRARLGYMLLNTLGITARCVTTREHAYVEVYLPHINHGKGGWTYLDFGGGAGADMPPAMFEEIPAEPSPSGASVPQTTGGRSSRPDNQAQSADMSLLVVLSSAVSLCAIAAIIYLILKRIRQKRKERTAMPFEDDFMASFESILANEIKQNEFASAALILLESALPFLKDPAIPQVRKWQKTIQNSMHCSKSQYQKIVTYIKENQKNKSKE